MIKVLLLYNQFIPSVQFCAFLQLDYLQKKGKISFQHTKSLSVTSKQLSSSDIIILVRADSYFEKVLSKKMKQAGKYLIYVLDDDLLNIPTNISAYEHYSHKDTKDNIRKIMEQCDCLLSPSIKILQKYSNRFKCAGLIEQPVTIESKNKTNKLIKIGFAGAIDRSNDIKKILPEVIEHFHTKYGDQIEFNFIGITPIFPEKYNIKYFDFLDDYESYRNKMVELNWDIGLAPLEDNAFNNCKHYNKFIEYSSLGIAGVYSNVTPYKEIITQRENGLLSENNTNSWIEMIESYIEDSNLHTKIVKQSQLFCSEKFSLESVSKEFLNYLNIPLFSNRNKHVIHVRFTKFKYLMIKVKNKLIHYFINDNSCN